MRPCSRHHLAPSRPRLGGRGAIAGLFVALAAGCGSGSEAPVWVSLARGFEPRTLASQVEEWERAAGAPPGLHTEPMTPGLSLRREIAAADWKPAEAPGCLEVALPPGAFRRSGYPVRLVARGREYRRVAAGAVPAPGEFRIEDRRLTLRLQADTKRAPPTILVLAGAHAASAKELALPPAAWRTGGDLSGSFVFSLPEGADPGTARLFGELVRVEEPRALAPFEYRVEDERVVLAWPGAEPPSAAFSSRLENGRTVEGQWQVRLGRFCATGIPVWSGEREELVADVPPESELTFRFAHGPRSGTAPVRARINLEGKTLFEHDFAPLESQEAQLFTLALPPAGRARSRFVLEVDGPPGQGVFFTPTLAPRARGRPGDRPWPARPDVVLFLADTLRADSLALHGGDPALAPNLNRLAARSLRFPRARSNAAWTLPSIGSLLSGLHPGQHGATDEDLILPASLVTLPERLERAGYRTGAITDGSFFAPIFGLDQGFEWFELHEAAQWDLDRTLEEARAFLEHDDGRPVFLVVHTYRVHQPYRVGPEEDRKPYDRLLGRVRARTGTDSPGTAAGLAALQEVERELRELYHEGVRDLDSGVGEFLAWLEKRSYFGHGVFVFTSDHGEALGENQDFFHGGHLWEKKLAVPLLLTGAGIEAREVPYLAGPPDLTPTIAEIAGVARDPDWVGASLLSLDRDRPTFAFTLGARSRQVACVEGTRKVIATPDEERLASGTCEEAFDLASDPQESHNLAGNTDWPAELTRRLVPAVVGCLLAREAPERAGLSPELRKQLDDLGYGGAEEEE